MQETKELIVLEKLIKLRIKYNSKYINMESFLRQKQPFRCLICNNEFEITGNVLFRSGCPFCKTKNKIDQMNQKIDEFLIGRDILRLDNFYKSDTLMNWKCLNVNCNKTWKALAGDVAFRKNPSGCPYCSGCVKQTNTIIDQRLINEKRSIIRLGNYINNKTKINWGCFICFNIWPARPDNIFGRNSDCPECAQNSLKKNELITKNKLIEIANKYNFTIIPTNLKMVNKNALRTLRFDVYFQDLKLAIEYNGIQHYEPVEYFGGQEKFEYQQECDKYKRQFCKENNIKLIEINGTKYNNKLNIENYIDEFMSTYTRQPGA